MIGTIRKHSKLLWGITVPVMIVSLFMFFSPSRMGQGGSGGGGDFGSIYGKKISKEDYLNAEHEFELAYFFRNYEWPDKLTSEQLAQQVYYRLLIIRKAEDLGIYVGDDEAAAAAGEILRAPDLVRALRINAQSVPPDVFVSQILAPRKMDAADFENFVRHDLAIQQLSDSLGLAGALVTPQEAESIYQREHEELTAQIVFFSASNYLSQVTTTPEAVAQYYTNHMADYRLPDRVQVGYVEFNVTNFLAQSKAEWAKTNLEENVNAVFDQYGLKAFPDAKTPDEARAKIREELIRERALADAHVQANDFANAVFNLHPDNPRPEDLAAVARQKGLAEKITAPFSGQSGPEEFIASEDFIKAAFALTTNEPLAGPIVGSDGIYVIAYDKVLPSEIPPLAGIRERVTRDFQHDESILLAQRAGDAFAKTLTNSFAAGKSFDRACVAAILVPKPLPPFSLSTQELPELGDRAGLNDLKQAAFTAGVGHASGFVQTDDGGFVVYVESQQPADKAQMDAAMPQFLASVRSERQNEAFNEWLGMEFQKQFGNLPVFKQAAAGTAP